MPTTAASSDNIRRAGKATVVLQVFAAALLIGLAAILAVIANRYASLQDGIRENALWSIYQLDRETRKLHEALHVAEVEGAVSGEMIALASQRYDILYSRLSILEEGTFDRRFGGDRDTAPLITQIDKEIHGLELFFNDINAKGATTRESLAQADATLERLNDHTESLLIYANNAVSSDRAEARADLLSLQMKSVWLIVALVASVGCLICLLRRQLRMVRAAGLSFETMAANLKTAYLAAEAGNTAKSQFMATVGHEIRTPLNAILGTAELLQLSRLPDDVRAGVGTIRRSGEALLEIINEILDYAKMEQGKLTIELRPTLIEDAARAAIDMLRDRAAENRDELRLVLPERARFPVVMGDPTRLKQVLLNLLSNAVKFTRDGLVSVRVSEESREDRDWIRFEVSDTGIGIDDDGLQKLFQPFSQVDASISRRFGGTGLGLAICKEIVENLGGKIGVSSLKGHGSLFWFELPAVAATVSDAEAHDTPMPQAGVPRKSVLLVEDNRINQEVATGFLHHLGQSVTVANDGLEAVRIAADRDFDLILMDMQMPNMDGVEATRRIRQLPGPRGQVPIVAMTANASEDDRRRCELAGMNGFQSKPLSLDKLRAVLMAGETVAAEPPPAAPMLGVAFEQRRREIVEALGEDGFDELVASFFDDAASLLTQLKEAAGSEDAGLRDRLLHTLKGASASVGLAELAETCQTLRERRLEAANVTALETAVEDYKRRLAA